MWPSFSKIHRPLIILSLLIVAVLAYWPGLHGNYVFDDRYNLMIGRQLQINRLDLDSLRAAAFSGEAGPLRRPISMLSFALNHYAAGGFEPIYFKTVNLAIHLLNGVAVYVFLSMLLAALAQHRQAPTVLRHHRYLALTISAAWLLHPLALTSVLYVVQRMNSLATLFTLLGLIFYLWGRHLLNQDQRTKGMTLMASGIIGFGTLASLSKENGALLPYYALLIEAIVYRFRTPSPGARIPLYGLFVITALLPLLIAVAYVATHPEVIFNGYRLRDYTLTERLLTEARILWLYLKWIVIPNNSELGLFHDDIPISVGWLQPATTLSACVGLVILLVAAFVVRKRIPVVTFGILWFFIGHSLESTFLPLELAHEHRNYLPMLGILVIVFNGLFAISVHPKLAKVPASVAVVAVILLGITTAARATTWSNNTLLYLTEVRHHPASERLNYEAGRQYLLGFGQDKTNRELHDKAQQYLQRSAELNGRSVTGLMGLLYLSNMDGRHADPAVITELKRRLRSTYVSAYVVVTLDQLAGARGDRQAILPHSEVSGLFDAVLSNPTLDPVTHGMLFSILSSYYLNQRNAYNDAVLLALKAIEVAPNEAVFNLSFANLLIAARQYEAAHEQLSVARHKDRLGVFAADIAAALNKIEEGAQPQHQ